MNFGITSDIPGRIRLRVGRDVFSADLERAVEAHFVALPYVKDAKACCHTGSVLLLYDADMRDKLLGAAKALQLIALVPIAATEEEQGMRLIDAAFKRQLASMVGWQLFRSFLLPSPIRKIVTGWRALRFFKKGWDVLRLGRLGVEVLDASAVAVFIGQGHYSAASSIMFLLSLSETLEEHTLKKTKSMLSGSLLVYADTVWVKENGVERQIPMAELHVGDRVVMHTGAAILVDGVVTDGEAVVNQAAMTGEPLGVFKKAGDSVFAGTSLEDGSLTIEVKALPGESRVRQIVDMISESESLKASIQGKAERIADSIVPFSFLLAAGVYLFTRNLTKALSVLLVDYSCAIKLATPIAVISAMQEAAVHRIVVKGGKFFEAIAAADTVVFDKTGTLTKACPRVSRVVPMNGFARDEVLRLAACMEEHFPHSVARAVVRQAQSENLRHEEEHTKVEYVVAHGIATAIHGKRAIIGSMHFVFEDEHIPVSPEELTFMNSACTGDSAIYLAVDGKLAGFLCINDPPRDEAKETIRRLRELGVQRVVMLTGDNENAARQMSETLGIDECHAGILPQDKAAIVEGLKREGHRVVMVGDGINDSPALAAADVSVSMKDSSDIAREVADITLLDSNLAQLVTARKLGRRLMRRISGNFNFIVAFNTALLALGIGNILTPAASALLHNLSTIGIAAASTRPCLPCGGDTPGRDAAVMYGYAPLLEA